MAYYSILLAIFICIQITAKAKPITDHHLGHSFSKNEIKNISACPSKGHGEFFVLCHPVGVNGPGDGDQIFLLHFGSHFEICSRNCFENSTFGQTIAQTCWSVDGNFVYHLDRKSCFELNDHDQSPCEENEMLVADLIEEGFRVHCKSLQNHAKPIKKRDLSNVVESSSGYQLSAIRSLRQSNCASDMVYSQSLGRCLRISEIREIMANVVGK